MTTMYVFCPAKIYMYKLKLLTINTELRKRPNHFLYIIKSLATNFQKTKPLSLLWKQKAPSYDICNIDISLPITPGDRM